MLEKLNSFHVHSRSVTKADSTFEESQNKKFPLLLASVQGSTISLFIITVYLKSFPISNRKKGHLLSKFVMIDSATAVSRNTAF